MPLSSPIRLAGLLALAMLPLAGCQAARTEIPESLSSVERMPVHGRQGWKLREEIRFGPFAAHEVDRSWTRSRSTRILAARRSRARQTYAFTLREGGDDRWRVECQAAVRRRALDLRVVEVEGSNRSMLRCTLYPLEEAGGTWFLTLAEEGERPLEGMLRGEEDSFEVVGTGRLENGLPLRSATGYHFTEGAGAVGAVEVVNDGAVWLRPGVEGEARGVLAATAAALLLLQDLREAIPE